MWKKLTILLYLMIFLLPNAVKATSVEKQTEALLETAWAYYRQGEQVQYDSYRKNLYSTPEDATNQHYNYTVCSGFTFSSYYHTFGIRIPDTTTGLLEYAENNKNNSNIVKYYLGTKAEIYSSSELGSDSSNAVNLAKKWVEFLKPGDIFVVTDHAMLVVSVDKINGNADILESAFPSGTGRYDYVNHVDKFEVGGSIRKKTLVELFNYYYNTSSKIDKLAVIRVMNDSNIFLDENNQNVNYDLTDSAKGRVKNKLIDIEKVAIISNSNNSSNDYADIGDIITYTITIKNTNSTNSNISYNNLNVSEKIDMDKVKFYDLGDGNITNDIIEWHIDSIQPGSVWTKSYSVKVKSVPENLGKLIISTGNIDDIPTSKIETLINVKFTDEENNKITQAYTSLLNSSDIERNFINKIYINSLNLDLGITDLRNIDIIKYNVNVGSGGQALSVKRTEIINDYVKKYIYNNNYGLRLAKEDVSSENLVRSFAWNVYPDYELLDRARNIEVSSLRHGDIILINTGKDSPNDTELVDKAYIYINNELIRKTSSTKIEKISEDDLIVFLRNMLGENYVILRPSIALERDYSDISADEEDNDNNNGNNNSGGNTDNNDSGDNTDNDNSSVNTDSNQQDNNTSTGDNEKPNPETGVKTFWKSVIIFALIWVGLRIYIKNNLKQYF